MVARSDLVGGMGTDRRQPRRFGCMRSVLLHNGLDHFPALDIECAWMLAHPACR